MFAGQALAQLLSSRSAVLEAGRWHGASSTPARGARRYNHSGGVHARWLPAITEAAIAPDDNSVASVACVDSNSRSSTACLARPNPT